MLQSPLAAGLGRTKGPTGGAFFLPPTKLRSEKQNPKLEKQKEAQNLKK
jgi:hypothetical protein